MATKQTPVLEPRQLNEADRDILDELHQGRASPTYLAEQTGIEQTYINQRLRRLDEHGHVENLARGLWEIADDPRDDVDAGADLDAARDAFHELIDARERLDQQAIDEAFERLADALGVEDA